MANLKQGQRSDRVDTPIGASTKKEVTSKLSIGTSSLDRARRVQRDGIPELNEAVEKGEVTVNTAAIA